MKKSDKKIERTLCDKLTEVCEASLAKTAGFEWITHTVNYSNVSTSLNVICVFDTHASVEKAENNEHGRQLRQLIVDKLAQENIALKNLAKQISFDSEEACAAQHQENWDIRLSAH